MGTSSRERWVYRIGLGLFVVYVISGIYLYLNPSDAMEMVFGGLMLLTLGAGLIGGIIAVYMGD
jgi:hypothetical protein